MAQLNRPLTEEEIFNVFATPIFNGGLSGFFTMHNEPRYQFVRYDADMGRVVYEDLEIFYWSVNASPSDSRWMVPGVVR